MNSSERICVLFGGSSDERSISIRSGTAILEALKRKGLSVEGIDARNGFQKELKLKKPDLAFIALHGKGGEDGFVQRVLQNLRIPFVGSASRASLCAFDKSRSKKIFREHHIPTPSWILLHRRNWKKNLGGVKLPAVIKPLRNGSSIGVVMVHTQTQLKSALQKSFLRYDKILVEEKIEGSEFTVGILGEQALPVIELRPKRAFYDFKAKYTKGLTEYLVPAPIDKTLAKKLQQMAKKTHHVLGLRDFSRVDFMVNHKNQPYVLEANSIPGFTETSLLPKAAQAVGIDFDELCVKLLNLARKRVQKENS